MAGFRERLAAGLVCGLAVLLALFLALAGIGVSFYALNLYLLLSWPAHAAAALTAGAVFGLALLILVVVWAANRRATPGVAAAPGRDGGAADDAQSAASLVGSELGTRARENPVRTLLAAFAGGFVVGMSPAVREQLKSLLHTR